jgi:hypothetical protein
MATVRDARRALAKGDTDFALVLLWNALEPVRLEGDRGGLEAIGQMAASIAEHGDSSQSREAERLLEEVRKVLVFEEAVPAGRFGEAAAVPEEIGPPVETIVTVRPPESFEPVGSLEPTDETAPAEPGDRGGRSKVTGLVWLIIVAAFILLNVVSRLVGGD